MIIVENKLEEIFSYLPLMSYEVGGAEFKVYFGYGDELELNAFLKQKEGDETQPYPLIWLLYPYEEIHKKKEVYLNDIVLIVATNTNNNMLNKERIATNFSKVLIPLYDNIERAFLRASNMNFLQEVKVTKFPNYSGEDQRRSSIEPREESFANTLWDALKTKWKISINDNCLKQIKL